MNEKQKAYCAIWDCYQERFALEKIRSMPGYSNYSPRLRKRLEAMIEVLRNQEQELKAAARDPAFIRRLEQTAIRKAMERSEKHSKTQQMNRKKRRTYHGYTLEEISERNQKIFEHFKKTNLEINSFAEKHAAKYKRSPRQVRRILSSKQLATNQVNGHISQ